MLSKVGMGVTQRLVPLIVLGCGEAPLEPLPSPLVTNAAHYVAIPGARIGSSQEHSFTIIATFTNTSRFVVNLARCFPDTPYPIYDIVSADRDTSVAYSPGWACPGPSYFRVQPGLTRVDTLLVRGPNAFNGLTGEVFGLFEGRFVLSYNWHACTGETSQCASPIHGNARSGAFTVTRGE